MCAVLNHAMLCCAMLCRAMLCCAVAAGNLVVTGSFDSLLLHLGLGGTYLLYALANAAGIGYVAGMVVETKCRWVSRIAMQHATNGFLSNLSIKATESSGSVAPLLHLLGSWRHGTHSNIINQLDS